MVLKRLSNCEGVREFKIERRLSDSSEVDPTVFNCDALSAETVGTVGEDETADSADFGTCCVNTDVDETKLLFVLEAGSW